MRVFFFDAAGSNVALGYLRNPRFPARAAVEMLREAQSFAHAERRPDNYGILRREGREIVAQFWNPDGSPEAVCGNAGLCIPAVLAEIGEDVERVDLRTPFGAVTALRMGPGIGGLELRLSDVSVVGTGDGDYLVNVGRPHRVRCVEDPTDPALAILGRSWARSSMPVSATFVAPAGEVLHVRNVERGLDAEPASSGTAALAAYLVHDHRCRSDHRDFREVLFVSGERLRVTRSPAAATITLYGSHRLEFHCDLVTAGEPQARVG